MLNKNKVKIGLDARLIFSSYHGSHYKIIIDLYKRIPLLEPSWEFYLYYIPGLINNIEVDSILSDYKNVKKRAVEIKGFRFIKEHIWSVWENVCLPIAAFSNQINLLHCPAKDLPHYTHCAKVVTIHDLMLLKVDQLVSQKEICAFRNMVKLGLKTAQKIITGSEYAKKEMLDTFGKKYERKIKVIHWAPEDNCRPLQADNRLALFKNKYSISSPYIFAFGGILPRKNIRRVLESFALFIKKVKKEVKLMISWSIEPKVLQIFKNLSRDLGIEEKVIFTGFIPEEDIPFLLSGAEFLVFVSLYEGFGLPPLDAMACDCPVIASNVTSIPEVVGDAAILVNPYDINEIADAMVNLFNNSQLRKELIEKGRERIKHFSWDKAARETLQVYREVLGI